MTVLDDTLARIDAVTDACSQCGQRRGDSPSDDFCSERCQQRWLSALSVALPDPDEFVQEIIDRVARYNGMVARGVTPDAHLVDRRPVAPPS